MDEQRFRLSYLFSHPFTRIALALLVATFAWKATFILSELYFGGVYTDYQLGRHIFQALGVFLLVVPTTLFLWKYIDRKPWERLGLARLGSAWKHFLIGTSIWLLPASIGLLACLSMGWVHIESGWTMVEILTFIPLLALLVFLYEAFPEELFFRGYVYTNLSEKMHGYWIVFVQAILFTVWGVAIGAALSFDRVIFFLAAAWVIGSLRMVSGNIWVGIGFHTAFQTVAQLFLFESRGVFIVENIGTLQLVALGLFPFTCAEILARVIYKDKNVT